MKTIYRNLSGLLLLTAAATGISSCVYDKDDAAGVSKRSDMMLNIRTTGVGDQTRATQITGDAANTALTTDEKKMQNLTIGLFKSSSGAATGITLDIKDVAVTAGDDINSTQTITSDYAEGLTAERKPANGDIVRVAINLPAAKVTALKGKTGDNWDIATESAFNTTSLSIDDALIPGGGVAVSADNLPMVGNSTMTFSTPNDRYESDVTVYHLVSKVTLKSLAVDFSTSNHTAASFTPTEIFLTNVPDKVNMDMTGGTYAYTQEAYTNWYQGESTVTDATQKEYLGTGTTGFATETLNSGNTAFDTKYTLYTLPNDNLTKQTYLVIKGTYSSDGQAWNEHTAYYGVPLGSKTDSKVKANAHYIVNVTIKGDGAAQVTDEFPTNIQDMEAQIDVLDFDDESVTATFTASGEISYSGIDYSQVDIGTIIYDDGSFTKRGVALTEGRTPIAVVFALNSATPDVSQGQIAMPDYDKNASQNGIGNFTHGYAMALKEDASSYKWSDNGSSSYVNAVVTDYQSGDITNDATDLHKITEDYGGLKHTNYIKGNTTGNQAYSASTFPAVARALAYTPAAPSTTSGWFLPSIGQQYLWLTALGGLTAAPTYDSNKTYVHWPNPAATTYATAINNYLQTTCGLTEGTHYTAFVGSGGYYWSSTERIAGYPFFLLFHTSGNLYLNGTYDASFAYRVRPVFAF